MARVRTDEETSDLKTRQGVTKMWKHMTDAAKSKAKQKWAIEIPKLDNARQLRGNFFIEPEDEKFKDTMKNTRRK